MASPASGSQLEGGGEQPLTEGPDERPRFAPDGASVLYIHDDGHAASAYRIALVGGQPHRVLAGVVEADISPDGRRVAFLRAGGGTVSGVLGVASADGREERILLSRPGRYLRGVRWSPDGRKVAVVTAGVLVSVPGSLVLVDPETGVAEDRGALGSRASLTAPAWLADSSALVLALASNTVGNSAGLPERVIHYDVRNGETHSLFWAPDLFTRSGRQASVFTVLGPGRVCFDSYGQTEDLRETGPDGRERVLTSGRAVDRQPVYSPDGRQILFSSNRSGNLDLWSVDRATGRLRQITDDAAHDWDPAFAPDGRRVVFTSNRSGNMETWMANADGSEPRQVSHDGEDAQNPTITADGWVVYVSSNPSKQGIWRVRADGSAPGSLVSVFSSTPEVSPDGRYAIYIDSSLSDLRREIRAVEIANGKSVDFRIPLKGRVTANLTFGRGRWLPGGQAIAFLDLDERGRSGIFVQDFIPGRDTSATRRKLAGFYDDAQIESFGISPDGSRVTLAVLHQDNSLMLADNVPGVR